MKKTIVILLAIGVLTLVGIYISRQITRSHDKLKGSKQELSPIASTASIKNGDIIFQTSRSQ